jgi:DNA-binding CsgD family transcriptional regulator
VIVGRAPEQARIDELLAGARAGHGGSLVIRGEAGTGKTALLEYAADAAGPLRVLRGIGIESETAVAFAGLHLLLHPYLDRIDALPDPQAVAMRTVFGLSDTPVRDRFLVGAGTLSMLSELAEAGPLVCLIDDAQWYDPPSADALLFAARRLRADPVALVFAARDGAPYFRAPGVDSMRLDALDRESSLALLNVHARGIAAPTRARILVEASGNPLAIIELTAALTARSGTGRTGWTLPVGPLPVADAVQDAFRAQIGELPEPAQQLLLLAAADDTADLGLLLRAGDRLGLGASDLQPAEQARLVDVDGNVLRFRHPLIRSAAYRHAPRAWVIAAHEALADSLPGSLPDSLPSDDDADRRAWHRAAAATGPDEVVAAELDRVARRAQLRGGSAVVATAFERAAQLSGDPISKATRLAGAARAAYDAGWVDRAAECASQVEGLAGDPAIIAEATWIRAQVAYERDSPASCAALALSGSAPILGSHPELAVSMLTDAIGCAKDACEPGLLRRAADQLRAVRLAPDSAQRPVVDGLIGLGDFLDGISRQSVLAMRPLVAAVGQGQVTGSVERVLAGYSALIIGDDVAATGLLEALADDTRKHGSLGWLPYAQEPLAIAQLLRGRFRDAQTTVAEALAVSAELDQTTQHEILHSIPAWLAAIAGDAPLCRSLAERAIRVGTRHPTNAALATWALGLLDLAGGRLEAAADHLRAVCDGPARRDFVIRAVPDYISAAAHTGDVAGHLRELEAWATATAQPHAVALVHRCKALLSPAKDAEAHFQTAVRLHESQDRPYDRARTQLSYGDWLHRQRRRTDARVQLADALSTFESLAATAWADRTRDELNALGDGPVVRAGDLGVTARLTPQELQVVRLAAAGLSNREIAAQLYLSHRTVGHHLYRAYPKLGISRRTELSRLGL